jgi:hypothetical protein
LHHSCAVLFALHIITPQVDLGGWLTQRGPAGWLYRPALGLGLVDQLIERLLTSVILIKDEVEQQRFRVRGWGVICMACCTLCTEKLVDQLIERLLTSLET